MQPQTEFLANTTLGKMLQATRTQPDCVDPPKHTNGRVAGTWRGFVRSVSMGSGRFVVPDLVSKQCAALSVGEKQHFVREVAVRNNSRSFGATKSFVLTSRDRDARCQPHRSSLLRSR